MAQSTGRLAPYDRICSRTGGLLDRIRWQSEEAAIWAIADMADSYAHPVTVQALMTNSYQDIAEIAHLFAYSQTDRGNPVLSGHWPNVFDS